jgi:hypothetical protein
MFQWLFFWRRKRSPKHKTPREENSVVREIAPETTVALEQRNEPLVLPVRSSIASVVPIPRIAEFPALTYDPRADYFTPGRYAPARRGTPVLKAPTAELDDRRGSRSLSRATGSGTD